MGVDSSDASRGARPALGDVTNEMGKKRGNLSIYVSPSKGNGERVCKENGKENICSGVENYKVPKQVPLGVKTQAVERPKIFDKEKSDCFGKQALGGVENRQVRKIYDVSKETEASFVKRVPLRLDFHQAKGDDVFGNIKALSTKQIPLKVNDVVSGVPHHVDKGSDHLSLKRVRSEVVDLEVEKSPMPKGAKTIGNSGLCPLKGGKAYRLQSHGGSPFSPEAARVSIEETTPETNKRSVFAEGSSVPRRGEVPDNAVQERNKGCIPIISLDDSPSPSNRILIEDGRKCRGDDGNDLTEVAQSGTTKEPSQASESHGRSPGGSYLSYSISGSVIGPRLTEFQHSEPFELTRCSLLKDDGCFSSGAGCDSIKGRVHFVEKDVKGRISGNYLFIWSDKKARLETIMNFLQEANLNHMKITGVAAENEFAVTNAMNQMNLIWVINRIHIEVNHFSSWGDVVEVDTWYDTSGKNSYHRYWQMRDRKTRQVLTKATSNCVMMNKKTRRMSRVPLEVRDELQPFTNPKSVLEFGGEDSRKIDKLSDELPNINILSNLMPRGSDMDMNQHVNSCKYIALILESVPKDVFRNYALTSVTLEYRRECSQGDVLESLMVMNRSVSATSNLRQAAHYESTHLLRRQDDKTEIARARIRWQYSKRS